jgi:Domain of unknown function (DUF1330)
VIPLTGDRRPERVVILEFPSIERMTEWSFSLEYLALALLRARSTKTRAIAVYGLCEERGTGTVPAPLPHLLTGVRGLRCRYRNSRRSPSCSSLRGARVSASEFYARFGWTVVSPVFDIADVGPRVRMTRRLSAM